MPATGRASVFPNIEAFRLGRFRPKVAISSGGRLSG